MLMKIDIVLKQHKIIILNICLILFLLVQINILCIGIILLKYQLIHSVITTKLCFKNTLLYLSLVAIF